ncbi:pyridoxal phosphate-dependent transferase [Aspergillus novoparasiticus]|uniref:Pyridoxal phosphate-dependent transferase n=1 Tax=Aspergillus novoparasiticus TaxID=986946 RepID=A0A5N6ED20_9EURO|nr:pyridoxal phosphate-dependent transferase [Aspergillus novoparasiticus]
MAGQINGQQQFNREENFNIVHSYFIGPKAKNLDYFRELINEVLNRLRVTRESYFPEDEEYITLAVRDHPSFIAAQDRLRKVTRDITKLLGDHSVPFFSPRYQAHMGSELTIPSLIGYFMTMLYNPNNVALEASPLTTVAEVRAGEQLCKLFGYNIDNGSSPVGWGHITCDGTVANLESIWVARNLKFYPLALSQAIRSGKLGFLRSRFQVENCQGTSKLFSELTTWELLNLKPETVIDLPTMLKRQFNISDEYLESALKELNIQSVGRDPLERFHSLETTKPIQYVMAKTRHYSWPKGVAIAGLGSKNITEINVDNAARLDTTELETKLKECAENQQAVYAVVAIIGSTEEGAVDSLSSIVELRTRLQATKGLSFLIHADAAWGGYFATILRGTPERDLPVPSLPLRPQTRTDLLALQHADTITVDPHKAGYIPYPAGSLVYRSVENIGVYGVEGSKPGAAAMSTWLSNQTIGLDVNGYGFLLGQAAFTSGIPHPAPLDWIENEYFICVPFNLPPWERPAENRPDNLRNINPDYVRDHILGRPNSYLMGLEGGEDARTQRLSLLRELGSDLNINAFALNWKDANGTLNTDLEEANYLMKKVVDKLSITTPRGDPTKIPLFLTSTMFEPSLYGECAKNFMRRLGISECEDDLFVLRNVVMSPFPTQTSLLPKLIHHFQKVVIEQVNECRERNERRQSGITFLMQGKGDEDEVFLVLETSFHKATQRQQLIFGVELHEELKDAYRSHRQSSPNDALLLKSLTMFVFYLSRHIDCKTLTKYRETCVGTGKVTFKRVVKSRPLNSVNRDTVYPAEYMPFYLYGSRQQYHVAHMLLRAPNIALHSSNVSFSPPLGDPVLNLIEAGLILTLSDIPEAASQPFPETVPDSFPFRPNGRFNVKVWQDPKNARDKGPRLLENLGPALYDGEMTLGDDTDYDAKWPNYDSFERVEIPAEDWEEQLTGIRDVLNAAYVA